jgi:dihydroorotate dehydrogenase electron transfer subunit
MIKSKVVYNRQINNSYHIMAIEGQNILDRASPGNFIMLNTQLNNYSYDPLLKRTFAISDIENGNVIITYKVVGKGTFGLTLFEEGDFIETSGILGNSFITPLHNKRVAIIAGGIGIAPFPLLVKSLLNEDNIIDLYYGGKTQEDIILLDKFKAVNDIIVTTEDGSVGKKGLITECVKKDYEYAYACGPNVMMERVVSILNKSCTIEVSLEERMACGIGICMGCIIECFEENIVHKKCCKDGPVFNGRKVQWQKIIH